MIGGFVVAAPGSSQIVDSDGVPDAQFRVIDAG
jgi:hypothetical protein